ncbi:hypothetical protein Lal_00013713 [Lupinus albus]|nr:hypothetical protein Lal_00013713 [Lupinus albus]
MVTHISLLFFVSFILACTFLSKCDAGDDNPKLHIVYMGSLPKTPYSPNSHHLSMMQQVFVENDSTNFLIHSYKRSFNGFAAMLTNHQKEKISQMEGVVSVFPSKNLQLHTTRSWDFLGLSKSVKRNRAIESDVVIGVLDTGVWPESDSFKDEGFGPVPKNWKGSCAGGKNFTCNKKIIGARHYTEDTARDLDGHGSHTASTAAGNYVHRASFFGLAKGTARGGVPFARIAAYKVCTALGCDSSAILSAFDDAIADGFLPRKFEEDPIAIGSFHAMAGGILTVNSAGNSGPFPASVSSVSPWMLSVAASTIDRRFIDKVVLGNEKILTGKSINSFSLNRKKFLIAKKNSEPDSEKCSKDSADICECLDSSLVEGKIVLCNGFSGYADYEGGKPIGSIIKDFDEGFPPFVSPLPSLFLSANDYDILRSYTNSSKIPKAEILKKIMKPDISAPGVDILASFSQVVSPSDDGYDKRSVKYNIISGTSMSCPHVAGIAAYLKTFHFDWSPSAIKSAIMTSANPMKDSKDEVGEYAYGSGHVNPISAVHPGLIYDISLDDYIQMLCNLGYDSTKVKLISGKNNSCSNTIDRSLVRDLNYPALAIDVKSNTSFTIKFERTVTNVGIGKSIYKASILPNPKIKITVVPETLSFKSLYEKQSFVLTVTGNELPTQTVISSLLWSNGIKNVRSPIIVNVSD